MCIPNCIARHHSALEQNAQRAKWEMGTNAELCIYLVHKDALIATGLVGALSSHSSQSKLFRCVVTALHKASTLNRVRNKFGVCALEVQKGSLVTALKRDLLWYYLRYSALSVKAFVF